MAQIDAAWLRFGTRRQQVLFARAAD